MYNTIDINQYEMCASQSTQVEKEWYILRSLMHVSMYNEPITSYLFTYTKSHAYVHSSTLSFKYKQVHDPKTSGWL